jgi:glycosyltransferase involved in cell wall biosynthesis
VGERYGSSSHLFLNFAHPFTPVKPATVSVINDLVTDQRVHKVCTTLKNLGFDVLLVGRKQRTSLALAPREYRTHRMKLLFERGVLFYSFFQMRLFFYLLFRKHHVLVSNDLDTLMPNYLVSKLKGIPLVYDSHEIFTEVPELQGQNFKQGVWRRVEKWIFPKLKNVFTVNQSISDWFFDKYRVRPLVVRNMPRRGNGTPATATRAELNLPPDKKIVLLQGAGINVDRGSEELVEAMKFLTDVHLLIVGSGDVIPKLQEIVKRERLTDRVTFTGKVPHEALQKYTSVADLGVTLDKPTNINYRLSLPNKIFDYIRAGVPVLCSDLPEVAGIVRDYKVGVVADSFDPKLLAETISNALNSPDYQNWKTNTRTAADVLCWETDEINLRNVYSKYL